jgi:hypothetical protein
MTAAGQIGRLLWESVRYHYARSKRDLRGGGKVFCIGRNKTGITSLASFFRSNGYHVGRQERAELLLEDWARRDFDPIIRYCATAEVFRDVPFSLPDTYAALDRAFPGSKFILTVRSSPEDWYNSLVAFHAKITRAASIPPSAADLEAYAYRNKYRGMLLRGQQLVYGYPAVALYDRQAYMEQYERHNASVVRYFSDSGGSLLTLNLEESDAFERLCRFLSLDSARAARIPHLNRTRNHAPGLER